MTEAAFTIEISGRTANLLTGAMAQAGADAACAGLRLSRLDPRQCDRAKSSVFQGGTIEGPTHFSQFAPLCERIWGPAWFATGCLSAHYRKPGLRGRGSPGQYRKAESRARQLSRSA